MNNYETRKAAILDLIETLTVSFDDRGMEALTVAGDTAPAEYTDAQGLTDCTDEAVWYDEVAPVSRAETAAELDQALSNLVRELRGMDWGFFGAGAAATLDKLAAL